MNVLITGGAGFIGSNLVNKLLAHNHYVTVIDNLDGGSMENLSEVCENPNFKFILADVSDKDLRKYIQNWNWGAVFHLAGISSLPENQSDPTKAFNVNVLGTINLLESLRHSGGLGKFIFASTAAVYENNEEKLLSESLIVNPDLIYSQSKLAAERIVQSYHTNYGMPTLSLRYFNTYGPNQNSHRKSPPLTIYLISYLLQNKYPSIFCDKNIDRDYVYIDDLNNLHTTLMTTNSQTFTGFACNVCSSKGYSVQDIFKICKSIIPSTSESIETRPERVSHFWKNYRELQEGKYFLNEERVVREVYKRSVGDNTLVTKLFNWYPEISMEEGLRRIVRSEFAKLR